MQSKTVRQERNTRRKNRKEFEFEFGGEGGGGGGREQGCWERGGVLFEGGAGEGVGHGSSTDCCLVLEQETCRHVMAFGVSLGEAVQIRVQTTTH